MWRGGNLLGPMAASLATIALLGCDGRQELCRAVTAVASDPAKMNYAKSWITSHLSDQAFFETLRKRRTLEYNDRKIFGPIGLDFDWRYLGFDERLTSLEFNLGVPPSELQDAGQVNSVELRHGRTFIIIRLNFADEQWLGWPPEERKKLNQVGEGMYVYCE